MSTGNIHREEGKIFHATIPDGGAVGGLYFGLYNDQAYQICATGGIGQTCYNGKYELNKDTLILHDLSSEIHLKSNKFLITRYKEMDNLSNWGEVIQLDAQNQKMDTKAEAYFVIRLDSLENSR